MLTHRREISCLALALVCGVAVAQEAAKTDAAAAAAAMERAQRQAANPMRFILEAGKSKSKPAADGAPLVATAGSTSTPRSDAGVIAPRMAPEPGATAAAPAAAPAPTETVRPRLHADALQRQTTALAVPALEVSAAAQMPALAAVAAPSAIAASTRPKILSMVEPAIPPRALDDAGPLSAISVDLTIRTDGSVATVAMVPPVPRQIQRYVVLALEQWRFEPLPSEQVHRVQLVFNSDR